MRHAVISTYARGIKRRPLKGAFAKRLWQLISKNYGGSQRRFAKVCGIGPRRVTDWLYEGRLPDGDNLRKIGAQTGYSVDWLLGFADVPEAREARAEIGALADAISESLDVVLRSPYREHQYQTNRPSNPVSDPKSFIKELQRAWVKYWSDLDKEFWARALDELADSLNSARAPDDDDEVQSVMLWHAIQAAEFASLVRVSRGFAERMTRHQLLVARECQQRDYPEAFKLRARRLASGRRRPVSPEERSAPFLVLPDAAAGGAGFAWRGKQHDHAWWIDTETGQAKSVRSGRFLVIGGHGEPPASAYEPLPESSQFSQFAVKVAF